VQYVLPNKMVLLVTLTNFEPNPMLVNINKLKSYKFIDSKVQDSKTYTNILGRTTNNKPVTKRSGE
jgi:hypothetical protein